MSERQSVIVKGSNVVGNVKAYLVTFNRYHVLCENENVELKRVMCENHWLESQNEKTVAEETEGYRCSFSQPFWLPFENFFFLKWRPVLKQNVCVIKSRKAFNFIYFKQDFRKLGNLKK